RSAYMVILRTSPTAVATAPVAAPVVVAAAAGGAAATLPPAPSSRAAAGLAATTPAPARSARRESGLAGVSVSVVWSGMGTPSGRTGSSGRLAGAPDRRAGARRHADRRHVGARSLPGWCCGGALWAGLGRAG